MYQYMTEEEDYKKLEEALLEQRRQVMSSRAAAAELIDSLGIRHLFVPMTKKEIRAAAKKRAAQKDI